MLVITERYRKLIERFPLQVIKNDADLEAAHAVAGPLFERLGKLADDEKAYLEVLSELIGQYEKPLAAPESKPNEILAWLLEQHDMKAIELAALLGTHRGKVSEYLSGKRGIPKNHIAIIAKRFNVGPELFVNWETTAVKSKPEKISKSSNIKPPPGKSQIA